MREELAPGRPREFDETEMLRKIMKLFWRGGYEGVSLADIMTETGLKKGSLYAAYGDKRAMYLKALGQYEVDVVSSAAQFLSNCAVPPLERLEAFLSAPLKAPERGDRSGCFLCNASADQADINEDARSQIGAGFDKLTRGLVSALTDLHENISAEVAAGRARALLAVYTGLRVIVRSGADIGLLQSSVDAAMGMASANGKTDLHW